MKKKVFVSLISVSAFIFSVSAHATDRPDHFKGKQASNWSEAQQNLNEYNQRLADLLAKDTLTPQDLAQVHELTYTLENALERMEKEISTSAEILEKVHVASETNQPKTVKTQGDNYLKAIKAIQP